MTNYRCPECGQEHEELPYPWPRVGERLRTAAVELCEQCAAHLWYQHAEMGAAPDQGNLVRMRMNIEKVAGVEGATRGSKWARNWEMEELPVTHRLKDLEGRTAEVRKQSRNTGTRRRRPRPPTPEEKRAEAAERKRKERQRARDGVGGLVLGGTQVDGKRTVVRYGRVFTVWMMGHTAEATIKEIVKAGQAPIPHPNSVALRGLEGENH